ncbi:uncharacterized protein BKA78DRAFT_319966 [Phyllosticta capitalensis]|uniref:uncharacterized protein n=1 Tax=Phyllosticta capitalensis TaxID=121624 RepID=UPI00312D6454
MLMVMVVIMVMVPMHVLAVTVSVVPPKTANSRVVLSHRLPFTRHFQVRRKGMQFEGQSNEGERVQTTAESRRVCCQVDQSRAARR